MSGVSIDVRAEVVARDQSRCVACSMHVDVGSGWYSLQHRRARGMGGSKADDTNRPTNLAVMCGTGTTGCHGRAEHDVVWARSMGYHVDSWDDPAAVPIWVETLGCKVLLTDDACYDFALAS